MAHSVLNKVFYCVKNSNSAAEAAEKFLAPQRGRPIKDIKAELESIIDKHRDKHNWLDIVETSKIIVSKLNNIETPPSFQKEEVKCIETDLDYLLVIDGKLLKYSKKQIKYFRDIVRLIDKYFPK